MFRRRVLTPHVLASERVLLLAPLFLFGAALAASEAPSTPARDPARPASSFAAPAARQEPLALEERLRSAVERALCATVGLQIGRNLGSGVIVSPEGHVLTAGHVAEAPGRAVAITLCDGRVVEGVTLGVNRWVDSGMVRITSAAPDGEAWPFLEMGSARELAPGDWVIALGHPGGVESQRPPVVRAGRVGSRDARVIRTDCTIASGDSGGPLVDLDGRVVGIHTSLRPVLVANDHLPIDTFRRTWEMLASGEAWGGGVAGRAQLGVDAQVDDRGLVLVRVAEGLAGHRAGLRAGDVVRSIEGRSVADFAELEQLVSEHRAGDSLRVAVERDDGELELDVPLDRHPSRDAVRIVSTPWSDLGRSKLDRELLAGFESASAPARRATVELLCGGRCVALGTVVRKDGLVVTKASELFGPIVCRSGDLVREARIVATDADYDLALLAVDLELEPVDLAGEAELVPGQWVISPDGRGEPASVGIVSVPARRIPSRAGYLGIRLAEGAGAAEVEEVLPDTSAAEAGLRPGDVLLEIEGREVKSAQDVTALVRALRPASLVTIELRRTDGLVERVQASLGAHPAEEGEPDAMQDRQSGPLSLVRSGFPLAVQHDSVLRPEECGGPLVDSAGRVVGVNLARAGRTGSFAIPAHELREVVERLAKAELR